MPDRRATPDPAIRLWLRPPTGLTDGEIAADLRTLAADLFARHGATAQTAVALRLADELEARRG